MPALPQRKLEDQRNHLIDFIETQRPQGSRKNKVTVIFDGKLDIYGQPCDSFVRIIFAKDRSADDEIKAYVESQKTKKNIVVVTNDRNLQYAVMASGAQISSVDQFLNRSMIAKASKNYRRKETEVKKGDEKYISSSLEYKITAELRDVWLKKNKD